MKKRWVKKIPFVIAIGLLGIFAFSSVVMLLWNAILPGVLHVSAITIWQAMGILLLCKMLFSGFRGRRRMHMCRGRKQMFGEWREMTDEEKQLFRERAQYCR